LTLCFDEGYAEHDYLASIWQDAIESRKEINRYIAYLLRCQKQEGKEKGTNGQDETGMPSTGEPENFNNINDN